jgi:hypothetical protein
VEIILGILAVLAVIIIIGKIKGPPTPQTMSDEQIMGRLQSENAWITKYNSLPYEHKQGEGIKKQHDDKQKYIMELMLELNNRHGNKEQESLAPVLQRTLELVRQGIPEEKAKEQAIAEYITARDTKKEKQQ